MKVQELVNKYNENSRINIAKEIETIPYVGIDLKRKMANLVMDNCTTVTNGKVYIDSVERYILFTMAVIGMHTNLEFYHEDDERDSIDDYDDLCKSGLLIKVIDTFKDDYASCQEILNMVTADRMQYNTTIEEKIHKFLDGIQNVLSEATEELIEKLDLDGLTEGLPVNQDKLLEIYNLIDKNNK